MRMVWDTCPHSTWRAEPRNTVPVLRTPTAGYSRRRTSLAPDTAHRRSIAAHAAVAEAFAVTKQATDPVIIGEFFVRFPQQG
jgi:hypothetical protein